MPLRSPLLLPVFLFLFLLDGTSFSQQEEAREHHMMGLEQMLEAYGDDTLRTFAADHLSRTYVESFADEAALLEHLRGLREAAAPIGGILASLDDGLVRLVIENHARESVIAFRVEQAAPHGISELALESSKPRDRGAELDWDTLADAFDKAGSEGFCGSILAVRDGDVVLDRGFGHADPAGEHPVTPDTLFAVGSTPIDFTHGAILRLEELGKLSLDDPLTRWFDDVPEDKHSITLEHLRTGRSGLLDFPGIEGVDANLDLSWIDRAEFLRRVWASDLLFEPGSRERHSHVAWGVLAAVVELASEQGYEEYLRQTFFGPAGMERTGHYPLSKTFPASEVAVGLGGNLWGEVNSPQHWSETSWLVLGSGGMVSTPRDLRRWRQFLQGEAGLGRSAQRKYGLQSVMLGVGGNDRGFVTTLGFRGDNLVIVCSNSHLEMDDEAARLSLAAARVGAGD